MPSCFPITALLPCSWPTKPHPCPPPIFPCRSHWGTYANFSELCLSACWGSFSNAPRSIFDCERNSPTFLPHLRGQLAKVTGQPAKHGASSAAKGMDMWIVRFVMAFFSVFAVGGEGVGKNALIRDGYAVIANATITVPSMLCEPITVAVPRGQYRLIVDLLNAPRNCSAQGKMRFTDRVYKPLDCISYATTGECGQRLARADELCTHWETISVPYLGESKLKYEGSECWDVDYFLAISTDCTEDFVAVITTELINLSEESSEACEGLVDAEKDYKEVCRLAMFIMVSVPISLVSILAFVACCFYCPGWPGHIILHMPRRPIVYRPSSSYRQLPPRPSQVS